MSKMIVQVRFPAGSNIMDCLVDAQEKAAMWNVAYVEFRFNGIEVSVSSSAEIDWAAKGYWDECMEHGDKFVVFS